MSYENKGTIGPTVIVSQAPDRSGNFVCNGAADDVEINLGLARLNALGGGNLVLREGTYTIVDPITFPGNNITLRGQGRNTFIDGDGLADNEHAIVISGKTDCSVENLAIQTNDAGGLTCHCIFIEDGSHRFRVENVIIVDSDANGIHIEGTTINRGYLINNIIEDIDLDGIYVDMDGGEHMNRLYILDNDITGGANRGIMVAASGGNQYWQIKENSIYSSGQEGILIEDGIYCEIVGNIVYSNGRSGIYLIDGDYTIIQDNTVYDNTRHGIFVEDSDYITVEGNMCIANDSGDTTTYDGIYVDANSDDNLILGNKCNDNDRYGINVAGARNRVKENDLNGNTTSEFNDGGTDTRTPFIFVEVADADGYIGDHPAVVLTDGVDILVRSQIHVPLEFQELVTAHAVIVAGAAGNMRRGVDTDWGKLCTVEDYDSGTGTIAAGEVAVLQSDMACIDISVALAGIAAGDLVGVEFTRYGSHGNDSVGASCFYLGIRVRYV